jgi:predicted metal-dependent hydrolase
MAQNSNPQHSNRSTQRGQRPPQVVQQLVVEIDHTPVPVRLVQGRAGRVRMRITAEGLELTTGNRQLTQLERDLLTERKQWILKHFSRLRVQDDQAALFRAQAHERTLLHGLPTPVCYKYQPGKLRTYRIHEGQLVLKSAIPPPDRPTPDALELLTAALRHRAQEFLEERTTHWGQITRVNFKDLRVKGQRSRWGSCSSLGNINLNWHLLMVPGHLADYVIIHELMHRHEMNHSARFWKRVADFYPEYEAAEQELVRWQWLIGIYDR